MPAGRDNAGADWNLRLRCCPQQTPLPLKPPPFEVACPLTVLAFSPGCRCLVMIAPRRKANADKMNHYPQFDGTVSTDTFSQPSRLSLAPLRAHFMRQQWPLIVVAARHTTIKQHNWIPRPLLSIHYRKGAYGVVSFVMVILVRGVQHLTNKRTVKRLNLSPPARLSISFLMKSEKNKRIFFVCLFIGKTRPCRGGGVLGGRNNWPQGAEKMSWRRGGGITKLHTNLFPWQGVLHKSWGGAKRQKQIKVLNTQGLLWRRGPLVNRLILTLGLRACCFLTPMRQTPRRVFLTPGQVHEAHFFHPI